MDQNPSFFNGVLTLLDNCLSNMCTANKRLNSVLFIILQLMENYQ